MSTELQIIDQNSDFLIPANFTEAIEISKFLMKSEFVPDRYKATQDPVKNNKAQANVLIALNMAKRLKADPLMVMQSLYTVYGNPGLSSKFLISLFNTCGKFSEIQFTWSGQAGSDDYGCTAWALVHSTNKEIRGPLVTIKIAKAEGWYSKTGSKWVNIPQKMLMFRAAAWMIDIYAPQLALGMRTIEEIEDIRDVTPVNTEETTKKTYSKTKINGAKEPVIEGETASVTIPPVEEKPQKSTNPSTQAASSWEDAKTKMVNPETGEIIQKTLQQRILEAELQKQKEQENV